MNQSTSFDDADSIALSDPFQDSAEINKYFSDQKIVPYAETVSADWERETSQGSTLWAQTRLSSEKRSPFLVRCLGLGLFGDPGHWERETTIDGMNNQELRF